MGDGKLGKQWRFWARMAMVIGMAGFAIIGCADRSDEKTDTTKEPVSTTSASPAQTATCAESSEGNFGPIGNPGNTIVGPLTFVFGEDYASASGWDGVPWVKLPALVQPGHSVTVKVAQGPATTGFVGYGSHGDTTFANSQSSISFTACERSAAKSRAGGEPVTFWSGGFSKPDAPACVPLDVYVDHSPVAQRIVISMGAGDCTSEPAPE